MTDQETFGRSLKHWRRQRGWSQMDLAAETGISARHLSFVETGRSQPSRDMVLMLAQALSLDLREQNHLLEAAGYTGEYSSHPLDAPEMAAIDLALSHILEKQEPYPALAMDASGSLLRANKAMEQFLVFLGGPDLLQRYPNLYMMMLAEDGLRGYIANWDELMASVLGRMTGDLLNNGDPQSAAILESMAKDVTPAPKPAAMDHPVFQIVVQKEHLTLRLMTVVSTFGYPRDITAQEIRMEAFYPMDEQTRVWFEEDLAESHRSLSQSTARA